MRQNFNVGQEIVSEDLNSLQSRLERGIFDRIVYEILQKKSDAFFGNGFNVIFQSATSVVVKAGLGFQNADTGTINPVKKPLVLDADLNVTINTPDSSNGRIDLLCVRANRYNAENENRKYKDEFTNSVTTQNFTVATDWKADVLYVAGTPNAVPVAPAIPSGYLLIAEMDITASTGIASQSAITDSRAKLPFCTSASSTGSNEYDAVVGPVSLAGVTHEDLKSALDNASDGWKILVLQSETLTATPVVLNDDIEIVFKKGATINRGTATIGLQVQGIDCKIVNARFKDFITGGDVALKVMGTAQRSVIENPRYNNCATNMNDLGIETFVNVEFTE